MALYSGHSDIFADLIAAGISIEKYMKILDQVAGPKIGEVKLTTNNTYPVLAADANKYITLSIVKEHYDRYFDGWVYANGAKIYKKEFPEAYEFFMASSYPGKQVEGSLEANYAITIPNICKFIKLNVNTSSHAVVDYAAQYATPNHMHELGAIAASGVKSHTITVPHAAWIWSTKVDTTLEGGKMPETAFDDGKGHAITIPEAPSAHKGNSSFNHYVKWDVPVDVNLNTAEQEFKSTTSNQLSATVSLDGPSEQYYPNHVKLPAMIYIGRKSLID